MSAIQLSLHRDIYTPRQPGFYHVQGVYQEQYVPKGHVLYSTVCCFFEMQSQGSICIPIIPDGCTDLIFSLEDDAVPTLLGCAEHLSAMKVNSRRRLFGVRLLPGAVSRLFGTDPVKLLNNKVILYDWANVFSSLIKRLSKAESFSERVLHALEFFSGLLEQTAENEWLLEKCLGVISETGGKIGMVELAEKTCWYNAQYIRKFFKSKVGLSPKKLCNIVRLQSSVITILESPGVKLACIAAENGYHDQSHMNREFLKYLGVPSSRIAHEQLLNRCINLSNREYLV